MALDLDWLKELATSYGFLVSGTGDQLDVRLPDGLTLVFSNADDETVGLGVGQIQFNVFADRLDVEFNAPIEILSSPYESIRLTAESSAKRLREIGGTRVMERGGGHLVALFESRYRLQRIEADEPDLMLAHIVAG